MDVTALHENSSTHPLTNIKHTYTLTKRHIAITHIHVGARKCEVNSAPTLQNENESNEH